MPDIEVPDMTQQLHHASWLLSDAWPRLSPEATGGASREELEWAVSVSLAHSERDWVKLQPVSDLLTVSADWAVALVMYLSTTGMASRE